jgi:hypothetical protein
MALKSTQPVDIFHPIQKLNIEVHETDMKGFFLNTPLSLNVEKTSE